MTCITSLTKAVSQLFHQAVEDGTCYGAVGTPVSKRSVTASGLARGQTQAQQFTQL